MNTHELWQAVLGELELRLSKANFTTWFKNTFISGFEGEAVTISVPNTFTKTWLEKKYNSDIIATLRSVSNVNIRQVAYKVDARAQLNVPVRDIVQVQVQNAPPVTETVTHTDETFAPPSAGAGNGGIQEGTINPKYTFDSFIVGKGSELAHAAALAVAENPGTKYNPLFIYGGVGLGKTHIAQAIGNDVLKKNPSAKILYVTCEKFINEFITAVKTGRAKDFKDTYRTVDVLIIDDIQFLTGRDGTQEEFFHTFNTLHQNNKQIVLTSDRPPQQIPALEQRLISRFQMGMNADISSPDFETRMAILETKCKERGYDMDTDIIRHIATVVQSNVRELEGALNKVIAYHQFKNTRPSLESAKSLLSSFGAAQTKKNVSAKAILTTVASYYDVSLPDMIGKCREKRLAHPRQVIMYLMREEMGSSYPAIGHELGGRDHTTAMHAYDKIKKEVEGGAKTKQDIDLIKQRLYAA